MFLQVRRFVSVIIGFAYLCLHGCVAAVPVVAGLAIAGAAAGLITIVNLARDQYPDIDFDKPAPVETVYCNDFNEVWNATVDTLMEMKESTAMMDKSSGVIRTVKKNLNDVSWIGKGLGKATFLYEYNITVRPKPKGVSVELMVPFWEEKVFVAAKEKNLPEGSNMMRHILYRNLNKRADAILVRLPDSPLQDIRHAPLTKETQLPDSSNNKELPRMSQKAEIQKDITQEPSDATKAKIKKSASSVNVRSVPLTKNDTVIATLKGGAEIELLEEKGDWVKIRFAKNGADIEGWINKYSVDGYSK